MSLNMTQVITVSPVSGGAAVFDITGTPNMMVALTILPTRNAALYNGNQKITFDAFTFGGSVVDQGGTAIGTLDALGRLNNVRLGAAITLPRNVKPGLWSNTLTLRVVYQ